MDRNAGQESPDGDPVYPGRVEGNAVDGLTTRPVEMISAKGDIQ
jgi:hypothetical protein